MKLLTDGTEWSSISPVHAFYTRNTGSSYLDVGLCKNVLRQNFRAGGKEAIQMRQRVMLSSCVGGSGGRSSK